MTDQLNKQRPGRLAAPQQVYECRITHIRYVALAVADLSAGVSFYRDEWGLAEETSDRDAAFMAAPGSTDPYSLRLRAASANGLDLVSFAASTREDVDWYADRLARSSVRLLGEPGPLDAPAGGYGFRFLDPVEGRTLEIAAETNTRRARSIAPREHLPVGLSHLVLNSARLPELVDFFHRGLGFYKSDYLEDVMVFLKGASPAHHQFAVSANPHANVNHVAYETRGIDEYLRATGSLLRRGHRLVWGPGRHGPGDNPFAYFADPNGFVAEYTTALEPIDDIRTWQPRIWHRIPVESDQWGTACARDPAPFVGVPDPGLGSPPPF
jgi:catechol 2,3-dioxygenase-like lactoylglutathione lyase family enzyme